MSIASQLNLSVLDELQWEPRIDANHIGATAVENNIMVK